MTEEEAILDVEEIMGKYGFSVVRIPREKTVKRPDLLVTYEDEVYLIEQKSKGEDPNIREQEFEELKEADKIERARSLNPRSVFSKILSDAIAQIESHPLSSVAFKIVWMSHWGAWRHANSESLIKGLYGSQDVFDAEQDGGGLLPCYYLGFSDFRRYTEIDAVVIYDGEALQMLINEFSPRFEKFLASRIAKEFEPGTLFPKKMVDRGIGYSLSDYDGDRRDREGSLRELTTRLAAGRMMTMEMNEFQIVLNMDRYLESDKQKESDDFGYSEE